MQFIEFKVVNTNLLNMGGIDFRADLSQLSEAEFQEFRRKQTEERIAFMNKKAKEDEERSRRGLLPLSMKPFYPFPSWVSMAINELASEEKFKVKFDDENRVYRTKISGDQEVFESVRKKFYEKLDKALSVEESSKDWLVENFVEVSSSPDDEMVAMNDLESHVRGTAVPSSRKVTEKEE